MAQNKWLELFSKSDEMLFASVHEIHLLQRSSQKGQASNLSGLNCYEQLGCSFEMKIVRDLNSQREFGNMICI